MKKGIFSAVLVILTITVSAQTKPAAKKVATPPKKPAAAAPAPVMKNALDSFSYALGLSMAGFYKEQGISEINTALVTNALLKLLPTKPENYMMLLCLPLYGRDASQDIKEQN